MDGVRLISPLLLACNTCPGAAMPVEGGGKHAALWSPSTLHFVSLPTSHDTTAAADAPAVTAPSSSSTGPP